MSSMSCDKLHWLNHKVIDCTHCSRLSKHIRQIGQEKVKRFAREEYWARPLPSWGDPNARLLIVGLAPAAHGGNRTGRMFTGDGSGDWLARAMYESGFANMPSSRSKDDGLVLKDAYITAAIRCAPPDNKPLPTELANCSQYLVAELQILDNIKVIVMLGKIGFDVYCRAAGVGRLTFSHGASYEINGKVLLASYHPSRQNTNTGKLTWQMWFDIFKKARSILDSYG
jgi:uracil-DNA glycosylase family 4